MTAPGVRLTGTARFGAAVLFADAVLDLVPGGWTCLLGPSGVGKSTALRLIAGLETGAAFAGTIAASDGRPLAGRVAYMAQDDLLLPWLDLRGNVGLGARLRGETPDWPRIDALIGRLGLGPHARKRPRSLSGGQRQRAALARTLMEDRAVVLLDEPFSALDARTRAEMQDLAAETLAGRTVLIVTHDPGEAARLGDRVQVMEHAALVEVPPPPGRPIRAVDDPAMLGWAAQLLKRLRADA